MNTAEKPVEQTDMICQQKELFKQHAEMLARQHAEVMAQLELLCGLLEHSTRVAEIQVIAQLLPMLGKDRETNQAIGAAISGFKNKDLILSLRSLMGSQSMPLQPGQAPSVPENGELSSTSTQPVHIEPAGLLPPGAGLTAQEEQARLFETEQQRHNAEALQAAVEAEKSRLNAEADRLLANARAEQSSRQAGNGQSQAVVEPAPAPESVPLEDLFSLESFLESEKTSLSPEEESRLAALAEHDQLLRDIDDSLRAMPQPEEPNQPYQADSDQLQPPAGEQMNTARAEEAQPVEAAQGTAEDSSIAFLSDKDPVAVDPSIFYSSTAKPAVRTTVEQQKEQEQKRDEEARLMLEEAERARPVEKLDEATEQLLDNQAKGIPFTSGFDNQMTVEQPFSEAFTFHGNRLYDQGKYAEAEKHYLAGLPTLEDVLGREHLAVVEIIHKLGIIAFKRGKYADAENLYQQALVRRAMALGENHPDTVNTMNDLGKLYIKKGSYSEAKEVLTQALELRRQVLGDEHKSTAQTCHDLGTLYVALGQYNDAGVMYERAYSIRMKIFGEDHLDTAQSKSDTGRLFVLMNKFPAAEKLLKQAIVYRKEKLGEEHPDYAQTLVFCSEYLAKLERYADALPMLEMALSIRKKSLGERHPDTAGSFNQIGIHYANLDRFDEAKKALNQGLYIRKTTFGENNPDTAASMHAFGKLCWRRGVVEDDTQLAEGLPLIEKSLNIRTKILGENHPDTIDSMNSLGSVLVSLGCPEDGEETLRNALLKRKQLFGMEHLSVAESDHSLALCLLKQGKYDEAKPLLEEEVAVRASVLGPDNQLVNRARAEGQRLLATRQ